MKGINDYTSDWPEIAKQRKDLNPYNKKQLRENGTKEVFNMPGLLYPVSANSMGTEDWLEASKGMVISAFIPTSNPLTEGCQTFTIADFERDLRKIIKRI